MILGGTVTSPAVQGVTTQAPADSTPLLGFGAVGNGEIWRSTPSPNFALVAAGTLTTALNIDWTVAGLTTVTLTASDTLVVTFGLGSSSGSLSAQLGQIIRVRFVGASGASITWPSTVTWLGATAPTYTGTTPVVVELTCTGTGSAPTFDGNYWTL
jgi:hypothetical protein